MTTNEYQNNNEESDDDFGCNG